MNAKRANSRLRATMILGALLLGAGCGGGETADSPQPREAESSEADSSDGPADPTVVATDVAASDAGETSVERTLRFRNDAGEEVTPVEFGAVQLYLELDGLEPGQAVTITSAITYTTDSGASISSSQSESYDGVADGATLFHPVWGQTFSALTPTGRIEVTGEFSYVDIEGSGSIRTALDFEALPSGSPVEIVAPAPDDFIATAAAIPTDPIGFPDEANAADASSTTPDDLALFEIVHPFKDTAVATYLEPDPRRDDLTVSIDAWFAEGPLSTYVPIARTKIGAPADTEPTELQTNGIDVVEFRTTSDDGSLRAIVTAVIDNAAVSLDVTSATGDVELVDAVIASFSPIAPG